MIGIINLEHRIVINQLKGVINFLNKPPFNNLLEYYK